MNILLLGSGGREHTFAWKMAQSPLCENLFIAPGNAGTKAHGTNLTIAVNDFSAIRDAVTRLEIDMVVVGPEAPLVDGIYDFFQDDPTLQAVQVVGPSQQGAKLEGSKAFAKKFMAQYGIPTAAYREFTSDSLQEGLAYLDQQPTPIVLKADGLAAGKGVLILNDREEAKAEFKAMLDGKFGAASAKVVVEEFLSGIEFSVFVLTDGESYQVLPIAKDYKRIGEGDTGLNTGGMGAVSPVPFVTPDIKEKVITRIVEPTIKGIQEQGFAYKGFVFLGLILVEGEPFVIEYNCRMGDPETEVVFPRLQNDLVALLESLNKGNLDQFTIQEDPRTAAAVILVSGGYPGAYEKGKTIKHIPTNSNSLIFHAGTRVEQDSVRTNGGRVIAITSLQQNLQDALDQSNSWAEKIQFDGKYFRTDIGFDLK